MNERYCCSSLGALQCAAGMIGCLWQGKGVGFRLQLEVKLGVDAKFSYLKSQSPWGSGETESCLSGCEEVDDNQGSRCLSNVIAIRMLKGKR